MNIPVFDKDEVIGTVNLLDDELHFTPVVAEKAEALVRQFQASLINPLARGLVRKIHFTTDRNECGKPHVKRSIDFVANATIC